VPEPCAGPFDEAAREAVQVAAMAIRYLTDVSEVTL